MNCGTVTSVRADSTCIDAAAHVGNKPIADFLLTHGARPTIFSAAMMGQLDAVSRAILLFNPTWMTLAGTVALALRAGWREADRVEQVARLDHHARAVLEQPVGADVDRAARRAGSQLARSATVRVKPIRRKLESAFSSRPCQSREAWANMQLSR